MSEKLERWKAALGISRYARRASHIGISFSEGNDRSIQLACTCGRQSCEQGGGPQVDVSGIIVVMVCGRGAVMWGSMTQKCVTLFTTEVEEVAMNGGYPEGGFISET